MKLVNEWIGWRIWIIAPLLLFLASMCSSPKPKTSIPEVDIECPADGRVSDTVTITAVATDEDAVSWVKFYVDTILRYTDFDAPYEFKWDCTFLRDGSAHKIRAKARNDAGYDSTTPDCEVVADNPRTKPRGMGFAPLPGNTYNVIPVQPPPGMGSPPPSLDLSPAMPPVGDQGLQASGVGWAAGYALKSYLECKEGGGVCRYTSLSDKFSPAYIYNQIKSPGLLSAGTASGACEQGGSIDDALELLRTKGCATLWTMPYDPDDCFRTPSPSADSEAVKFRIKSWGRVEFTSTDAVKRHLAGGYPVLIGFAVYENFFSLPADGIYSLGTGDRLGDHAACVVGYDNAKGAFKILNSWGADWSDNGYGWISYGFFDDVCTEAYAVVDNIDSTQGCITVTTNHLEASFTVARPGGPSYSGDGASWTVCNAAAGVYTITYGAVSGFSTPPPGTDTLSAGSSIGFTGSYQCVTSAPLPAPARIGPAAGDLCISTRDTLMWSAVTDPSCGGAVKYDVYFGTTNPPPIVDSNRSETWYPVAGLSPTTKYYWQIVARGTRSRQTPSSLWDFTTGCGTALPDLANPHPANNATCQSTTDTLTWTAVTDPCGGSVTYDMYFGTVNPPPKLDSGVAVNSFARSGMTPNTPYYWRVDVRGDCGRHTAGTLWSFTPACKTSLPAPSNPTPATGTTGQSSTVTLIWSNIIDPCGGTVTYDVYFGTADPLPRVAPGLVTNSYLRSDLLSNQKYYWKVCVKAPCRDSVFGPKWDFTTSCTTPLPVPVLQSPADNATCQTTTDTLRWSTVTDPCGDPVTYDVYFGTVSLPPKLDSGLTATSYIRSSLAANTKYYWKVCAKGTGGRETCVSTSWSFTTKCTTLLTAPAGPSPADGATGQPSSLTLGWNAISDPCGGAVTYDVYAGTANPPPLVASGLTSNTHFLTGLPDGLRYWKVRVNGTCDRHTDGPVWSFTVGCTGSLPAPSGPNPEDSATGQPASLTLFWTAVIDPCGDEVKYDVYFGVGNSPPLVSSNQTGNWYTKSGLSAATLYSWKIVAKGTEGRQTPGPKWVFKTECQALTAPSGPNPLDGATCNPLVDTLTWTAAIDPCGDPVKYDVYFGTVNPPPKLDTGLTVSQYLRNGLAANTKYYWKVCAEGTDSRETCGPVWSFTTGCPKSLSAPVHLLPANTATGRPTTDTLGWSAVSDSCSGSVTYKVYFGTAPSPPLVDSNWASIKYPVTGLTAYQTYYWKICARGQGGCQTCAAVVWNFQTGCPALSAPSVPTPADSALDQPTGLTLQWIASADPCAGAVKYDVYCDTICPPTKRVAHEIVTNYYPLSGLTSNKWYCWKVVALGTGSRSTTGPQWHFKTVCPALLTAPVDPSPADSASCQTKPDTLRWGAAVDSCGDPVTYDVYFGTTSSPPIVATAIAVLKYHPVGLVDTTKYYWKVIAKGTRGRQTPSDLWNFTTKCPTLLSAPINPLPANGAGSRPTTDTLRWDAVVDPCGHPVTYDVYFDTAGSPRLVAANRTTISYPLSGLSTNESYYWKVCAKGAGGCMACSEVWIFSTGCALPKPGPHTPTTGATCQLTAPTFSWAHVSDPCGGPVTYDVYVDTASPPTVKLDSNLNVNYIVPSPALLANTKYYWKVCAKGTGGRETCGDVWDFWVGCNTPLPTPSAPSPATDTTCNPIADTLTWAAVTEPCGDSVVYDVYFGTANPPPLVASNLDTVAFPRTGLVNNTKYYWKVCVKGLPGGCQTCSPVWNFTTVCTKGLSQLTLLKPGDDSTCAPFANLDLDWSSVVDTCGGSLKYDLFYDTDTSLDVIIPDLDSSRTTIPTLLDDQIYYWQVRARGTCGRVTYSLKWHFTTACTTSLPLPGGPDPGNGASGTPVNDPLTWTTVVDPCGGDVTYDVYFDVSNPPTTKVCSDLATADCPGPAKATGTLYYWKVVAKGICGRSSTGPVWSFTTGP